MNIPVRTASGKVIVRPDTTWKRDDDSCWMPDFVGSVSWTPVVFAQISRLGKSVSAKFAGRYYDAVGFGFFLYPDDLIDGSAEGFACASCLDHTTFLSYPEVFGKDFTGDFRIIRDGDEIFRAPAPSEDFISKAVEDVTSRCLVRRGDLLAIELQERSHLCSRPCSPVSLKTFADQTLIVDIRVIL